MCGILAALGAFEYEELLKLLKKLEPRGPEYTNLQQYTTPKNVSLGFTRLAINGLTPAGHQPLSNAEKTTHVICNGEIYNYKELAARWKIPLAEGTSDCAVLPTLAKSLYPTELCRTLDGVFAFVILDTAANTLLVARDPYGVRPLFEAISACGTSRMWASEIKALPCTDTADFTIKPFPPGTWKKYSTTTGELLESQTYHRIPTTKLPILYERETAACALRTALVSAVKKRLISDRPIGALLSGGLDSSLIASIAAQELAREGKRLTTFSIGMPGSTDLAYAKQVATHINSIHHEIILTPQDFLNAIPKVIEDIESYDITTVRASVGNWLIGKYIKENTDIKVIFNGDGSDEVGGGYLYFYAAPSDEEFEAESERLLKEIHLYDVLRSDRSMAAHGLEARTPFLDKSVVATWLAIPTEYRRPSRTQVEKCILREAFAQSNSLPTSVLWRKKEAFSDGVSSAEDSWYKRCIAHAESTGITLSYVKMMTTEWHNAPQTQEAFWYRMKFEEFYGADAAQLIPRMWMPRWIAGATDPSARTLTHYSAST